MAEIPTRADAHRAEPPPIARLTLSAETPYLAAALGFVRETAGLLGLAVEEATGLAHVVEQVGLNVIARAFEPGRGATFDVVLRRRPGEVVVAVEDQGLPFDFENLERAAASGAGAFGPEVDAVRFENLGDRGNRVEIVKRLVFQHVESYLADSEKTPAAPAAPTALDRPVTLRLATADDAVAVARCTYSTYGYTAPDRELYFPDRLRELLDSGLLQACVGTSDDGEVVSYLALELDRPGARVGNVGEAMVDPRYRGHGLFEKMKAFLRDHAAVSGMLGMYSEAITVHQFSQKGNIALGACETGIQLGDEAPTVVFKQIEEEAQRKRTATVLYYLRTREGQARIAYPPAHHEPIIRRIYEHGRFPRELRAPDPAPEAPDLPASSQLRVEVFPEWSEASITVTAYGRDLPDRVRERLRALCLQRIDWIGVDLPLSHPGAREMCASLEALGFFFAGVIPELAGDGDVLRLQYLNDIDADLESAQIASDFGKELFAYVVGAMEGEGTR